MRHVAHARRVGLQSPRQHFRSMRESGAGWKKTGPTRPPTIRRTGRCGPRAPCADRSRRPIRKSPRPHLQSPASPICRRADDAFFIIVVDHAPEITAVMFGRRIGRCPWSASSLSSAASRNDICPRLRFVAGRRYCRPARRGVGRQSERCSAPAGGLGFWSDPGASVAQVQYS